jgi:hypothetical protein
MARVFRASSSRFVPNSRHFSHLQDSQDLSGQALYLCANLSRVTQSPPSPQAARGVRHSLLSILSRFDSHFGSHPTPIARKIFSFFSCIYRSAFCKFFLFNIIQEWGGCTPPLHPKMGSAHQPIALAQTHGVTEDFPATSRRGGTWREKLPSAGKSQ